MRVHGPSLLADVSAGNRSVAGPLVVVQRPPVGHAVQAAAPRAVLRPAGSRRDAWSVSSPASCSGVVSLPGDTPSATSGWIVSNVSISAGLRTVTQDCAARTGCGINWSSALKLCPV
jgi:hypothetical protein